MAEVTPDELAFMMGTTPGATTAPAAPSVDDEISFMMQRPAAQAPAAAAAPRVNTDEILAQEGLIPNSVKAFSREALNTALFNLPRNAYAALDYYQGKAPTFDEAYARQKAIDEALSKQHPNASMAGTAAGLVGPLASAVVTGGTDAGLVAPVVVNGVKRLAPALETIAPAIGRAASAGAYGAGAGALSEYADSKDAKKAAVAGAMGGALGAVANPAVERLGGRALDDVARLIGDRPVLKALKSDTLTRRVEPTMEGGRALPGQIAPSEERMFEALKTGAAVASNPATIGALVGSPHGMAGAMLGAALGREEGRKVVGDRINTALMNRLDPVIDRHLNSIATKYGSAWDRPYQFRAPSQVGRAAGNGVDGLLGPGDR
ncbi:hypothetical protein FF100_21980 [Methylobacterium terricola]|uniref:Uncharacterized protein n=1 Tax=Methylobacterium terricola TaxID=2583531 RepID=A0A5C4LCA2_9HYPH|nr:hypothetical protein [Methylobacterium terricola]TNC10822.1 hypothetical protein FF100_21980 [Methylobacterium terricola]